MLTISGNQMRAMESAARDGFAQELCAHCFHFAPAHAAAVGQAGIMQAVTQGMERAAARGFDQRGPVRFWIDAMLMLGGEFDTDPQYPWVGETLAAGGGQPQLAVADRLHARTMGYVETVGGPGGALALAALRQLRASLNAGDPQLEAGATGEREALLRSLYPAKADHLGGSALQSIVATAARAAQDLAFSSPRAQTLIAVLMYSLGHACLRSPLFPWIARTLEGAPEGDSAARSARLESRMTAYLDVVLSRAEAA